MKKDNVRGVRVQREGEVVVLVGVRVGVVHHCERHKTTVHTGRRGSVSQTSPSSAHTRAKAATVEVTRSREKEHDSVISSRGGRRTPLWIPRDYS